MTRLTLYWHLRNITDGVPESEAIPVEKDKFGVKKWDYESQYTTTGSGRYAKKNGEVNIFYNKTLASMALNSNDFVNYLDAVSHDPCVPVNWRIDASELLSHHIMERRLICSDEERSFRTNNKIRDDFIVSDLPKKSMQSDFWTIISCPKCLEKECLFNVDKPKKPNCCLNCGKEIPLPKYP